MFEAQVGGVKKQAEKAIPFSKGNVLARIAVRGIADNGVVDAGEMPSQLMSTSGARREGNERVASRGIATSGIVELAGFEGSVMGFRSLRVLAF